MLHSCKNQPINLHFKTIDWFLYESNIGLICVKDNFLLEVDVFLWLELRCPLLPNDINGKNQGIKLSNPVPNLTPKSN